MLKQLIQRLLDSRTTPAQAAHSSLRDTSSPTEIFTGSQTYTAPSDGLVTVYGKSTETGGSAIGLTYNDQLYFYRTFQSVRGWQQAVTAPVSKGEKISVVLYNLTEVSVKFFKTFGGGYNTLVRRAQSCLKPSFNYLPRSFCKANPNGLHPKAFQKGGYSCHLSLLNMSLLTMDTLAFTKTLQTQENLLMFMPLTQLIQSLQGFAWTLLRDLLHTQKLFLLEKAARSLLLMKQIQSKNYGSRRLSAAINNLEVGGASC